MKRFKRFFSEDSPKAIKADKYGYLNGINYMAPHSIAGVGNMCAGASPGCKSLCLGMYSGQASFVADLENGTNNVRESRIRKTRDFMSDVQRFMDEACEHVESLSAKAKRRDKQFCGRFNGSTDIPFERIIVKSKGKTIFDSFPEEQFVDYTKILSRLDNPPANLHLTFSRSETNESECKVALSKGFNVAVVFERKPKTYLGRPVIDGDAHDLRHLDKRHRRGYIIGLSPKGNKRDTSGFIVRESV